MAFRQSVCRCPAVICMLANLKSMPQAAGPAQMRPENLAQTISNLIMTEKTGTLALCPLRGALLKLWNLL